MRRFPNPFLLFLLICLATAAPAQVVAPFAQTNLADTVASLKSQGVSVYTYPLVVSLSEPQVVNGGAFSFSVTGPPGVYSILDTTDLATWTQLGTVQNVIGSATFTDLQSTNSTQKFYRALLQIP